MITIFDPEDVELQTVDVWPFDTNTEEVVIKMRIGGGHVVLRVLVDIAGIAPIPLLGAAEVVKDD